MKGYREPDSWRERLAHWHARADETLDRLFPERQIHLRTEGRVSYLRLTRALQIQIVAVLALVGGWMSYASISYVLNDRLLAAKDEQIGNARVAYRGLLNEVADYQKQFTSIARDVEENNSLMLGFVERNRALDASLENQLALASSKEERERLREARLNLQSKLTDVEREMRDLANRNFSLKGNLDNIEHNLQTALAERNKALFEGSELRRKVAGLEERLQRLQVSEEVTVKQVSTRTDTYLDSMEKVVEKTGLDVDKVLAAAGFGSDPDSEGGQGGPFIEAKADGMAGGRLKADLDGLETKIERWDALQKVMASVPLVAPMDYYYITSPFGKRRDPINNRWASHYGLDFGGTLKSPVYATAPGVVTYAGRKGNFGNLVEIDHGAGIRTRYAHLFAVLVKIGQKVDFHDKIGLLGNTGRSTGAHLHYEVAFKGKALNPINFIKAGRYVFKE